jgi:hypothetical protein
MPFCTVSGCSKLERDNFRLCAPCRERLRTELAELPDLYEDVLGLSHYRFDDLVRTGKTTGICRNDAAVAVRADMLDLLASWATLVVDERGVAGPQRRAVPELVQFLNGHLDWLATHPAAADLADEIGDLAALAHEALAPKPATDVVLGRCARPGCSGTVRATTDDSLARQVSCDAGHVWKPHQWLLLGREPAA